MVPRRFNSEIDIKDIVKDSAKNERAKRMFGPFYF